MFGFSIRQEKSKHALITEKMKFNFFKKRNDTNGIQEEWNTKGEKYAKEVNEMVEFGEKNGWENWKKGEPEDKRDHLADKVIALLKTHV